MTRTGTRENERKKAEGPGRMLASNPWPDLRSLSRFPAHPDSLPRFPTPRFPDSLPRFPFQVAHIAHRLA